MFARQAGKVVLLIYYDLKISSKIDAPYFSHNSIIFCIMVPIPSNYKMLINTLLCGVVVSGCIQERIIIKQRGWNILHTDWGVDDRFGGGAD